MKEVISKIIDLKVNRDYFLNKFSDLEKLSSTVDNVNVKDNKLKVQYGPLKLSISVIKKTEKYNSYSVDVMGFKDLFIWLQAIPVDEENCRARVVIHYEISMIGKTIGLEESCSPENLKISLDKTIEKAASLIKEGI